MVPDSGTGLVCLNMRPHSDLNKVCSAYNPKDRNSHPFAKFSGHCDICLNAKIVSIEEANRLDTSRKEH